MICIRCGQTADLSGNKQVCYTCDRTRLNRGMRRYRERQESYRKMPPIADPIARALKFCHENFGPSGEYRSCLDESRWYSMTTNCEWSGRL